MPEFQSSQRLIQYLLDKCHDRESFYKDPPDELYQDDSIDSAIRSLEWFSESFKKKMQPRRASKMHAVRTRSVRTSRFTYVDWFMNTTRALRLSRM